MKKITLIKSFSLFIMLLCAVNFGFGQTTLAAGDIAITGFNSDDPDQFSFVLLTDVTTGTSINFTDNGWQSSGSFRGGEGTITWTATSNLPCGTVIVITDESPFSSSVGSVTDGGFQLSIDGDQILAYQGLSSTPTFIYAIHFDGTTGWSADATTANTSAIPSGLTNGTNAIAINDTDNATYDCSVTSDNSLILSAVSNSINWISSGSILTIGDCYYSCTACSGGTVTWNGAWVGGSPDITTQVIISTNYNTANGGSEISFSACSLKVENGATLNIADNDYIEVENVLTVDSGCFITVQPYGAFIQNNDTSSNGIYGNISVVKKTADLNVWYEYTYWSSPVSGETIGGGLFESEASRRYLFNGQNFLDATAETSNNNAAVTGQDDIDDNGDDWQWLSSGTIMQPGVGYAATHSEAFFIAPPMSSLPYQFDYTFEGPFNNGVITVPIYRNDSELADNNWNLIGNPYPSAIDADLFLAANTIIDASVTTTSASTIDGAIFLWSQATDLSSNENGNQAQNFSDSDYAIINGTGETAGGDGTVPSIILPSGNRAIPSGQAFFISMSNAAPATLVSGDIYTADVIFNNSMRVFGSTDNSQFFKSNSKKNTSLPNKLRVNLTSDNGVFNQTLIGYVNGASNNDDGAYFDAQKNIATTTSAILYSTINGSNKKFAIQGKAVNSLDENEIIKLGFKTIIDVATLYKLSVAQLQGSFLTSNTIYLKDNLTGTVHDLSASDYTFTSEVGEFNERFEIMFTAEALSTEDNILDAKSLKIVQLDNDHVQFSTSNNLSIKSVTIFDLLGRQLYNLKGNTSSETYKLSNLNKAVYIAKVELSNGAIITKKSFKN
ncbi:T9SS type A sorting domain-containing protein [Thalassobellus citreus]|uniref:T9SS type A sorting domain-containing protein n=1 Tax=Thalassobellus citreus TaxID=3367752 RepID=UPI0037B96799